MQSLAEFKRELTPGLILTRSFFEDGQLVQTETRAVMSADTVSFATRGDSSISSMPFGKASEWDFDNYIAGWAALWTDPEDPRFQVQYKHVEAGF